jgi:hypothetical protein
MIAAVQTRCGFAPGELIVVWAESAALGSGRQHYLVIDAAVGIVERGSWAVKDAVRDQPWFRTARSPRPSGTAGRRTSASATPRRSGRRRW